MGNRWRALGTSFDSRRNSESDSRASGAAGLVEDESMASFNPEEPSGEVAIDDTWGLSDTANEILILLVEVSA